MPDLETTKYPGIYAKGNRYIVRYRQRGKGLKKSFRTLTEARRFKRDVDAGAHSVPMRGFIDYASGWLDDYSGRTSKGVSESTRASYEDAVDRVIVPYFKREMPSVKLEQLSPSDLRDFIAHLAEQGVRAGHRAPLLRPAAGHAGVGVRRWVPDS